MQTSDLPTYIKAKSNLKLRKETGSPLTPPHEKKKKKKDILVFERWQSA